MKKINELVSQAMNYTDRKLVERNIVNKQEEIIDLQVEFLTSQLKNQ